MKRLKYIDTSSGGYIMEVGANGDTLRTVADLRYAAAPEYARAMAAAPDMREALEEAEPLLAKLHSIDADIASWNVLLRVRKAMRKADGGGND